MIPRAVTSLLTLWQTHLVPDQHQPPYSSTVTGFRRDHTPAGGACRGPGYATLSFPGAAPEPRGER